MKTILLPREWNSPDESPDVGQGVLFKTTIDELLVGYYSDKGFVSVGYTLDEDVETSEIIGWAAIVQQ